MGRASGLFQWSTAGTVAAIALTGLSPTVLADGPTLSVEPTLVDSAGEHSLTITGEVFDKSLRLYIL